MIDEDLIKTETIVNEYGLPEVLIIAPDNFLAVKLNNLLIYGDRSTNLKRFSVTFDANDIMALPSWRRGNDKATAEAFLNQHLNLLRETLRDEGKMFLESLLTTWEGSKP
jgi:hypothetical protein